MKIQRKIGIKNCIAFIFVTVFLITNSLSVSAVGNNDTTGKIGGGYAVSGKLSGAGYSTVLYNATNGLPTSEANCILGASDGYVWIGGYSGIIRYDGTNFERLPVSGGLTNGRGLFEDSRNRIWVATNDNGVVVVDNDIQTHFTKDDGLSSSSIRTFAEDKSGNVYIGSTAGISYVDRGLGLHPIDDERINNEVILKLIKGYDGNIIGLTKNGHIFEVEGNKVIRFYESEELGEAKITAILADPQESKKIYYGCDNQKLYFGEPGEKLDSMHVIDVSPVDTVQCISYDCDRIWVSSGLVIGYLNNNDFKVLENIPMNDAIEMQTSDYQGNMWVASSRQGVMKVVTNNFQNYSALAGLPDEVVNAICYYENEMYVGTDNGLRCISTNKKARENAITEHIEGSRVRNLLSDSRGNLWISTFKGNLGLVCLKADNTIVDYNTENGMPSNEVRCVIEMKDKTLIAATNKGMAVIKDGKIEKTIGSEEGMVNTVILNLCEGENGEILAGSDGDGLYEINPETGEIRKIGTKDGLTSEVIMRVRYDDKRKLYWIITSNSIEYMKDGMIKNVSTFPYNNNFDIFSDKQDNMWVLSSRGLYSVKAQAMLDDNISEYRMYTLANGLTSIPIGHGYSLLDDDGTLYIAGSSGVSKFNIENYFEEESFVITKVRSVYYDDTEILPDEKGTYVIPSGDGRIQITPAILDYTMSNPTVHVFLEGAEDDGITVEQSRLTTLEYTGLGYGNYILHIQIIDRGSGDVISDEMYNFKKEPGIFELATVRSLIAAILLFTVGILVWRILSGTVIRKQYAQIQEARNEAERANLAKSRFLANMSHEIRTPINTIMGMDEMILREDAKDVPKGYFLNVVNYALDIRSASESLLGLINDLLDISKIESGKMHLVEQEYDVASMFRSVVAMIRARIEARKLFFDVVIDETVPKKLYGDEGKIKQIIINLLTNAVKYTKEGGFTLNVKVEKKDDLSCVLKISVKDTGIGIKEEDLNRLFNAYERLDEEKNSGIQGTGLGLDISRQFAELMNAKLWCESVYGEGSEFIFEVTQKIADATEMGAFNEDEEDLSKGPYVPQFIAPDADILVVDDNPMNLSVIKELLKSTKVFVTTAESGEEALEKIKNGVFNVVLLDHMMPGMDGIETLAKIRETHPDLPVYALTANAVSGGEEFYKSKGFNGYLAKPIDSTQVECAIMKHLPEEIMMKPTRDDFNEEESELSEEYKWLYDAEGISVSDGIKHSGGISSFISSLKLFLDTMEGNISALEEAFANNDIRMYTIKVHSLKSSARIIGAMDFSKKCQAAEDAGNANDSDYIKENHEQLMTEYKGFSDILSRLKEDEKNANGADKPEISDEELSDAYEAIKELIPQMDYDSVEMVITQINEYKLPEKDEEIFAKLEKLLMTFDWEKMEDVVRERNEG